MWGGCEPSSVKITAHVVNVSKVHDVLLFLRLKDTVTIETTDWGGGAIMDSDKKGTFTYTLTPESFSSYKNFSSAWGQYQLVATDAKLNVIGRSAQYLNKLTVAHCP